MKKKRIVSKIADKTSKSILRGIKYHSSKALNKPQDITFLVYSVTRRCNSKCVMCNIWEEGPTRELSVRELEDVLSGPFFSKLKYVNLTGGEPFLRSDLADIAVMFGNLPDMKAIQIPTNGFLTKRTMETVESILGELPSNVHLSLTVSLDGDENVHDKVRGIKGAYKKATATLKKLQSNQDSRLNVGIATTVSGANIHSINKIYSLLKGLSEHVGFYPAISSDSFYGNVGNEAVRSDAGYVEKAIRFFSMLRDNEPEHAFYYDKVVDFLETGLRTFECLAAQKTAYLSAAGELFPCFMLSDKSEYSFGKLLEDQVPQAWIGERGSEVRRSLAGNPYCSRCSLSCDLINNFNEEFFEMSFFYLRNPRITMKLFNDLRQGKVKSKNLSE